VQRRYVGIIVGRDLFRSSTVAITLLATRGAPGHPQQDFKSSTIAARSNCRAAFSIFGKLAGSRAMPRCTRPRYRAPFRSSKPFGSDAIASR